MRKIGLLFCLIALCLLSACSGQTRVLGKVREVNIEDERGVVSFVVETELDKEIGICMTDETAIFSFVDGITVDAFKKGDFTDVTVSVELEKTLGFWVPKSKRDIPTYNAKEIQITGVLTDETLTLADGMRVAIWHSWDDTVYTLENGTELMKVSNLTGPADVYVVGHESLNDLGEEAQANIVAFYEEQGLLYNLQDELEKAYNGYLKQEETTPFNTYIIRQEIAPTASNEQIMVFLTSVVLPIDNELYYEYRIGATFERKTGKAISNWELFSCSPEKAKQAILDIAGINDPVLREEMKRAFKPENIILFPEYLEICFQQGTLPSYENSYMLSLDYDERLSKILHEWAVPKKGEQK